jgi:transcriptional regulator with XRE-family HTH domain
VIDVQPEVDYLKIGQRIKSARLEQGLNQTELGKLVGCSNNHMSHIEIGQTKVSLSMLLRISYVLKKDLNYFLLDTPYAKRESIVNGEIAQKLEKCNSTTLVAISRMIDILIEQQSALLAEND